MEAAPAAATAPTGRAGVSSYRILRTSEVDAYDAPIPRAEIPAIGAVAPAAPRGDRFRGTARKAAKTAISSADVEDFEDIRGLIATLPNDDDIAAREPRITTVANSRRVTEEERNVRFDGFIYAASREDDNDFHIIVGTNLDDPESIYMNIELSGLPRSRSRHHAQLKAARDTFKGFFGAELPGMSYDFYDPPISVRIEGSLFFDASHVHGFQPGPSSLRDDIPTIWEVHPISQIEFEP